MKKKLILLPLAGILCYVLSSYSTGPGLTGGLERTGASGTAGCGGLGCHSPSATTAITVKIELYDATGTTLITPVKYVPGTAYQLKVTGTNTGSTTQPRFGFQVSAVKTSSTTNAGTLTAIAGTHLGTFSGINVVEHSSPIGATTGTGGSGSTYVVNIPWTAPVTGTGSVTAFTALNAVNFDAAATSLDLWNNSSLVIPEATSSVPAITGTATVCTGATTTLTDAMPGGTWSSSATTVATVGTTGVVTGVAKGTATITYDLGASGNATTTITVTSATPAAIAGASVVCVGTHINLSDASAGGTWSSSATTVATAGTSGTVTGVTVGTATITYTTTNSCGTGTATHTVSVHAAGGTCVSGVEPTDIVTGTSLKIYPNPNRGTFSINVTSEDNTAAHVIITSITGSIVKEYDTITNKGIDITIDRPAGIYFLSARTISGIFVSKVLTQ